MTKSNWLFCIAILCVSTCLGQTPVIGDENPDRSGSDSKDFFHDFMVSVKTNNIRIQWKARYSPEGEYFIVERSNDQSHYETVSALKITDTISSYDLTNNTNLDGSYFYRVKWVDKSGNYIYSKAVPVRLSADFEFKFYPNPADKLLIVRTAHDIGVEILDGMGIVRLSKELSSGLQVLNLSTLEKGNYVLRIADKESNRVISAQLLKN